MLNKALEVAETVDKVKFVDQVKAEPLLYGMAVVVVVLVVAVIVLAKRKADKKKRK